MAGTVTLLSDPGLPPVPPPIGPVLPPAPPAAPAARAAVQGVLEALDALRADPPHGSLSDGAALLRAAEALHGLALREVAAVHAAGAAEQAGHGSTASWVRSATGCSEDAARASARLAVRLDGELAGVGELLRAGRITLAHARAVQTGLRGLHPDEVATVLPDVCQLALLTDPVTLARELRERAHALDDGLLGEQERRQQARRGAFLSQLPDGCYRLDATLTAEGGQVLQTALDALVHGERASDDTRSAAQRRADALVRLAGHALDCPDAELPEQGGMRAQLHVIVPVETLAGQPGATPASCPGSSTLLTADQLLRLACDADISRVVLSPAGMVLDLGRLTRTVTPAQWRALLARDQHCVAKGCRQRPARCQAHYVQHWARGGASDLTNYALLCHTHHHQIHDRRAWVQHRDGRWLTPDGYLPAPGHPPHPAHPQDP